MYMTAVDCDNHDAPGTASLTTNTPGRRINAAQLSL